MQKPNDEIIIKGLRDGEEWAFRHIYENHYQIMCFIAQQYLHDKTLSENVVSDVIAHLWEIHKELQIEAISVRSYLIKCVRNRCISYIKSQANQQNKITSTLSKNNSSVFHTNDNVLGWLLEQELEEQIHHAVDSLPTVCRHVFLMSRIDGKKREEIAVQLDISVNTVKYHLKRAMLILNEKLGEYITKIPSNQKRSRR